MKKTKEEILNEGMNFYTWKVEFKVHKAWVENGFDLTDQRALHMLSDYLRYANIEFELRAKVIESPTKGEIRKAQGYKN